MCAATKRIPALESRARRVTAGDGATRAVLSQELVWIRGVHQHVNRQKGQGRGSGDGHLPAVDGVGGGTYFDLPRSLSAIVIDKVRSLQLSNSNQFSKVNTKPFTTPSLRESFTLSSRGCRPSNPEQVELASQDHSEITHSSPEGISFRPLLRFSLSYLTSSRFDIFPANHAELGTAPIEISSDGIEGEASHWLRMGCQLLMNGLRNIIKEPIHSVLIRLHTCWPPKPASSPLMWLPTA